MTCSVVSLCTLWAVAMGFPKQEYWSGLSFPSPGERPHPETEPRSPALPGGPDGKESACSAGDLGWEDPLEKEMATYSSTLAWRIPWTEDPGGLQSTGSQRVGHN